MKGKIIQLAFKPGEEEMYVLTDEGAVYRYEPAITGWVEISTKIR